MPALPQKIWQAVRPAFFVYSFLYLLKNKLSKIKQKEGMCRIKDVKEIFHARALLIIVSKHQGKDENHVPLGSSDASAFKHLYTELADTEEDIHNAEQIFLLLQEIHEYPQDHERKTIFIQRKIGNNPRKKIPG